MIDIRLLELDGVLEILPKRHGDTRGFFSETWNRRTLIEAGVDLDFVQDNHSRSSAAGTLRGLHFQTPPHAQAKLVRVVRGAILDVAVDIRKGSPTFGHWVGIELSDKKWNQVLVPVGFAHGFLTLEPDTEVAYKVTDYYAPHCDRAIRFDDPAIGVPWPANVAPFQLSAKDSAAPLLAEVDTGFVYP
jgi:dTDP-4-dehydrorhamnose 3,5-epimerase